MGMKYNYDQNEFVLVCRKSDWEKGTVGEDMFLVYRSEWEEDLCTFDLLLTVIKNDVLDLYTLEGEAIVIVSQLPSSEKSNYILVK
jgi:hypothetical protein